MATNPILNEIASIKLCGAYFPITYSPKYAKAKSLTQIDPDELQGFCQWSTLRSERSQRFIYLDPNLTTKELVENTIHEGLHACMWWLDEHYVTQIAEDLTRFLVRQNLVNMQRTL